MRPRFLGFVIVLAAISVHGQNRSSSSTPAKAWTPPKTASGEPDLQGMWTTTTTAPFERPAQFGNRPLLTDEEYAQAERQLGRVLEADGVETVSAGARTTTGPPAHWNERASRVSRQTSLVVEPADGRVPVTAAAEAKRDHDLAYVDSWEYMSPWDRCITRGMPAGMFPGLYGNVYEIVQSPGYVAIVAEMIHETRIIPTNGQPRPNIRQWSGVSIGRWQGNTLVVETTNFNNKGWIGTNLATGRIKGIPQSDALRVIERFTRVDANTIQYEITINDPQWYTSPWKVTFPFTRDPTAQMFEYACHEGNYAMSNILSGARAEERAKAEAATK
jgi:hypothetical protein